MNQEGNYFLKDIDENYKHKSLLVPAQLRLSYQLFFLLQRASSFLRSLARAEMYKLCKSTGPRYLTRDSRLRRSWLFLRPFFAQKMVIKEERDCLQSTSTKDMNKGSLHSNDLLRSSDFK